MADLKELLLKMRIGSTLVLPKCRLSVGFDTHPYRTKGNPSFLTAKLMVYCLDIFSNNTSRKEYITTFGYNLSIGTTMSSVSAFD